MTRRTLSTLITFLILLGSGTTRADQVPTLNFLIQTIKEAENQELSRAGWYDLIEQLDQGKVSLSEEDAKNFTQFLLTTVFNSDDGIARMKARQLLLRQPHPLAGEKLKIYLKENPDDPLALAETAKTLMSLMEDSWILSYLLGDLQDSTRGRTKAAIPHLVDLGDPRAIEPLRALKIDTALDERLAQGNARAELDRGRTPNLERIEEMSHVEGDRIRSSIDAAVSKLRLMRDAGISCAFDLPDQAMEMLAENSAVIMPWGKNEMYEWYDDEYPFVTTDLVYHTHMILVRAAIDELEKIITNKDLGTFARLATQGSLRQAKGRARELALDNAALMAVPAVLCGELDLDQLDLDTNRRSHVEAELSRIRAGQYQGFSPLLGVEEDYTEYRLRGKAGDSEVPGYFQARTWLARASFPVKDQKATRRSLLLAMVIIRDPDLNRLWTGLDAVAEFLAGPRDDPDFSMVLDLAEKVSGEEGLVALDQVLSNEDQLSSYLQRAAQWPGPKINTGIDPDREGTLGPRLLGQRYSVDGQLFQMLMEEGHWPVSGVQVAAGLLGSKRAKELLAPDVRGRVQALSALLPTENQPGVMNGFLASHRTLFQPSPNLPEIFTTDLWQEKQINAALGAWAETRHAAAPYLKSAHTYMGSSMMTDRFHGYVEPHPVFYRQLKLQAQAWHRLFLELDIYSQIELENDALRKKLDERYGKADKNGRRESHGPYAQMYEYKTRLQRLDSGRWPEFMSILEKLADLSERELRQEAQTVQDGVFLKGLGNRMRRLSSNHSSMNVAEEPMARITHVATEYLHNETLEVGVGPALALFVAVPDSGRIVVCRGAVYSYFEMVLPVPSRLDDQAWAGLSAGLTVLGEGPWLAQNSGLYYQPQLKSAALRKMLDSGGETRSLVKTYPWRNRVDHFQHTWPWVGYQLATTETELLLSEAARPDGDGGLQLFVHEQLSRRGADPLVLEFCRSTLDRMGEGRKTENSLHKPGNVMSVFWALQTVARFGDTSDKMRLHKIEDQVARLSGKNRKFAAWQPPLEWLVFYAQQRLGVGN